MSDASETSVASGEVLIASEMTSGASETMNCSSSLAVESVLAEMLRALRYDLAKLDLQSWCLA